MKSPYLVLGLLIASATADAQLAPYWIPAANCVKNYESEGMTWTVEVQGPLALHRRDIDEAWDTEMYEFDADGDIAWLGAERFEPAHLDPSYYTCTPPVKVLDYPLTTGKTWEAVTSFGTEHYPPRTLVVSGTIIGPGQIDTPLGLMDVIVMTLHYDFSASYPDYSETLYLQEDLGEVMSLTSLVDCGQVPTEGMTWGAVKSYYR